jgi:serine/threonine protein kinase
MTGTLQLIPNQYRSPEEFAGQDLNEKIDIFSFGNNIYSLMTGLWPFYENEDDGFVQKEIVNGKTAFIDKRYRSRSYAEGKMVELIEQCWRYKAVDRPDIFEVVRFLRRAIEVTKAEDEVDRPKASNY